MTIVAIPVDQATLPQLRYFAESVLGLELAKTSNSAVVRAKIEAAMPNLTEIRAPEDAPEPAQDSHPAPIVLGQTVNVPDGAVAVAANKSTHEKYDPRVLLVVLTTGDQTKAKDVQIAVNDSVIVMQRGKKVSIPYRHYLALNDAMETIAVDTDEINPLTNMPKKEWITQHSYPFQVWEMPSDEAIAEWTDRLHAADEAQQAEERAMKRAA